MDKKIFLIDKSCYRKELVENLTEKDLEEWVADNDYEGDNSILKIDANAYDSVDEAIDGEGLSSFMDLNDYYVFTFGF